MIKLDKKYKHGSNNVAVLPAIECLDLFSFGIKEETESITT